MSAKAGILQKMCLKSHYSLRRQLLVSFGTTSILAIGAVMIIATLTAKDSGRKVKNEARQSLSTQVTDNLGASSRYVAEIISRKLFDNLGGAAAILEEGIRDRIVGYPNMPGYADDTYVPFYDTITDTNVYPLQSSPLPLDWNLISNINVENALFHLGQSRLLWYDYSEVSTAHATFFFQGQCDPGEANIYAKKYYPSCTDANNNVTTGGVVQPTVTNKVLAEKSADLQALLKPLYEQHEDVKLIGVYFANSGAGASVSFPGTIIDSTVNYTSVGCDWMAAINIRTMRALGTQDEIQRCHPEELTVFSREYNPLERGWCKDQALNPGKTMMTGPYLDAFSAQLWLLTIGRAVFDRMSGEFIGCTLLDVSISKIQEILDGVKIGETSEIALARWDDGTVVSSSQWDASIAQDTVKLSDLKLGIDDEGFDEIRSLVDYEKPWTPQSVQNAYRKGTIEHEGRLIAFFPIPVPDKYYENYSPEFIVVLSIEKAEVFDTVDAMDTAIDDDVAALITRTLIVGFSGLALVLVLIWIVSIFVTKPLAWMAKVAGQVVNNAGNTNLGDGIDAVNEEPFYWCSPKTEVTHLVSEFGHMIHGLGGKGAASVVTTAVDEVRNTLLGVDEFEEIHAFSAAGVNNGKNVLRTNDVSSKRLTTAHDAICQSVVRSPLFCWIALLIVTPLLLTMATVCIIVSLDISNAPQTWLEDVEIASLALQRDAISTAASARANFASEVITEPIRDLHILTRVGGWLLSGALKRSNAFVDMDQATEECKTTATNRGCAIYRDKERTPCDCSWEDIYGQTCTNSISDDPRTLQNNFYAGQSNDADELTGTRSRTSYPNVGYNAQTTAWWDNVEELPGANKGSTASGYASTYDRLRVISALAVAEFPIYNHAREPNHKKYFGTYVGFEADGMMVGYEGCSYSYAQYSNFRSTIENGAYDIRNGTLCPLGKYGYDCRCRDWYDRGKQKGISTDGSGVHVTPPYVFTGGEVATSITNSLIDFKKGSGIHVGQVLIDFVPEAIMIALDNTDIGQSEFGFPVLLTPETNALGGDTIIGPGYSLQSGKTAPPIEDLVQPYDDTESDNRVIFKRDVLRSMQAGNNSEATFTRSREDGSQEEVYITWAAVKVNTLRPRNAAEFSNGVTYFETLVYSVGIAIPEADLILPFQMIEDDINKEINLSTTILIALICVAAVLVSFVAYTVTFSITRPVMALLRIVRNINDGTFSNEIPVMAGGSQEASQVYDSFEKLYKVVRFSNSAFFSGDLHKACHILVDALKLFRNLDNHKAIGVASNNLGTTLLQLIIQAYSEEGEKVQRQCQTMPILPRNVCRRVFAKQHFDETVRIGEEEYESSSDEMKGDFAQQLANRFFNRGVFALKTRNEKCAEKDAEPDNGYEDFLTAKRLDKQAHLLKMKNEERHPFEAAVRFDVILRRVQALSELMDTDGLEDIWGVQNLINEAESMLSLDDSSPLFADISRIGRLQQLEASQMRVFLAHREKVSATHMRTIMRMMVHDQYILKAAFDIAARSIHAYFSLDSRKLSDSTKLALRRISKPESSFKNIYFCLDYSGSMSMYDTVIAENKKNRICKANENMLMIFDEFINKNDNVGFLRFNHSIDNELRFGLQRKGDNYNSQRLRKILSAATTATGATRMYTAIATALSSIVESPSSDDGETWIIALTDGASFDAHHDVKSRIASLNETRLFHIHVIIVGVEVSSAVVSTCVDFCTVSDDSAYLDARGGIDAMDQAFKKVACIITGNSVTMETF